MKKIIIFIFAVLLTMNISGCGVNQDEVNKKAQSEDLIADECMEQIISAIENRDVDALVDMFAPEALNEINLDLLLQETEKLFNEYHGTMNKYDGELSTATSRNDGNMVHEIKGFYEITTTEDIHHILFIYKDRDDGNSESEGLSMIVFVTDELFCSDDFYWKYGSREPGIYIDK